MSEPGQQGGAGASGVQPGGGDQGATLDGESTGPGGDTSPAVVAGDVDPDAQAVVRDLYKPDGERQDDGDVTPQPRAENAAVVEDPALSPEVAAAAAAEIGAAELGNAATAGLQAPGGESAPDPK